MYFSFWNNKQHALMYYSKSETGNPYLRTVYCYNYFINHTSLYKINLSYSILLNYFSKFLLP